MRANYFKLGLFVIIGTGLLLLGIAVLGAGALFERQLIVETYFEESVEGLGVGSAVKYEGIQFGAVSRISTWAHTYDPESFLRQDILGHGIVVEMALDMSNFEGLSEQQVAQFINRAATAGLRARKTSSGLTGPDFIGLEYLDAQLNPPVTISWTPRHPYIPWVRSEFGQIIHAVTAIVRSLETVDFKEMTDKINTLIDDADVQVNNLNTARLSDDADALLEELRASNKRLQAILNNPDIDSTLDDLAGTMGDVRSIVGEGEGDLKTFIADLPQISGRLQETVDRINEILNEPQVQRIIDNLDESSGDISPALDDFRRVMRRIDRLIAGQEGAISDAIGDLRMALDNIESLTEDAKENPSRILFGDPPPKGTPGDDQ